MQNRPFFIIVLCTSFTVIGLVGGYLASSQKSDKGSLHAEDNMNEEDHSGHDHGDEHGNDESNSLSAQALKNLKVKTTEIETSSYTTYRSITARIESTPKTIQPILAPIGGVIKSIDVEHGEMTKKDSTMITLIRDSISRPEIKIVSDLLSTEGKMKGVSSKEISELSSMSYTQKQSYLWKNILTKNGYWNEQSEKILTSLPVNIKNLSYTISLIGEISANGYLNDELFEWVTNNKQVQNNFFNTISFILDGKSIVYVNNLLNIGAFDSLVSIKAPNLAPDYDIHEINVKVGDKVEMGQKLGVMHDMRQLHIEAHAQGSEIEILMNALEKDLKIAAVPLAKNSGIELKNLKIRNIQDDSVRSGTKVHLEIPGNLSLIKDGKHNKRYRSWKIRIGTRYIIRVPIRKYDEIYLIPSDAVIEDGAEKIVFIEEGDTFKPVKVVVVYQNDEVAVLGQDSDIFAGDVIVTNGAFGLGLALKAQTGGAVDAHASHSH